jgi:hypothetical protein
MDEELKVNAIIIDLQSDKCMLWLDTSEGIVQVGEDFVGEGMEDRAVNAAVEMSQLWGSICYGLDLHQVS